VYSIAKVFFISGLWSHIPPEDGGYNLLRAINILELYLAGVYMSSGLENQTSGLKLLPSFCPSIQCHDQATTVSKQILCNTSKILSYDILV
jgi:hypothetical protein